MERLKPGFYTAAATLARWAIGRRISQMTKSRPGSASPTEKPKNGIHPKASAIQPPGADRMLRGAKANADSNAYCVAVCAGEHSDDRKATNAAEPMPVATCSMPMVSVNA